MVKVHVVFYSMYGHVYQLAEAVAEGAQGVDGAEVQLFQVPELVPEEALAESGAKEAGEAFAHVTTAEVSSLAEADDVIFGTPTDPAGRAKMNWRSPGSRAACNGDSRQTAKTITDTPLSVLNLDVFPKAGKIA